VQVVPVEDRDRPGGGGVLLRSRPRGPAAQEVEENPCVDGLGQRGERAGRRGLGPDGRGRVGGDDDEARPGAAVAQPAEHGRAGLAGHRHVRDHEVGVVGRGLAEGVVGAGGLAHRPAGEAQQAGHATARLGLVVDDQGRQHWNHPVFTDWAVQP
jgi:hypothetical protein